MLVKNQLKFTDLDISQKIKTKMYLKNGECIDAQEEITAEHYMDIFVQDQRVVKVVCTPTNLQELVIGRLVTERIISKKEDIDSIYICETGNRAKVYLNKAIKIELEKANEQENTCCTDNKVFLKNIEADSIETLKSINWKKEWIFDLAKSFSEGSFLHKKTKGTHSCYLSCKGNIVFAAEDIGRHNALDKVIGWALLNDYLLEECIIFTSGRVPTDMVRKAIAARVPVLVSKAVPTDQALELAEKYHLTLICRAWQDSFEIY